MHHAARLFVVRMLIGYRQVFEYQPYCLHGVGVGVGRGKDRDRGLERVGQAINAGVGRQSLGHRHDELRIDDGYVGRKRIIDQRDFNPPVLVGHYGEGSDLTARAAGRSYRYQTRLIGLIHRVLNHTLTNVEERCRQLFEISLGKFVFQLHDLGGVDYGAATQRDNLVDFVGGQRLHSLCNDLDVGLGVGNDGDANGSVGRYVAAHLVHVAELLQGGVGDDEGRTRWKVSEVLNRVHVEVNLVGNTKPHVCLRPARYALDVEVVVDVDIVGRAVAAARPAAEGEGRDHVVVHAAQGTDRSGRIDDDATGVDHLSKLLNDRLVVRKDHGCVSQAAGMVHIDTDFQRLVDRPCAVHRQHREKFFDGQRDNRGRRPGWER